MAGFCPYPVITAFVTKWTGRLLLKQTICELSSLLGLVHVKANRAPARGRYCCSGLSSSAMRALLAQFSRPLLSPENGEQGARNLNAWIALC